MKAYTPFPLLTSDLPLPSELWFLSRAFRPWTLLLLPKTDWKVTCVTLFISGLCIELFNKKIPHTCASAAAEAAFLYVSGVLINQISRQTMKVWILEMFATLLTLFQAWICWLYLHCKSIKRQLLSRPSKLSRGSSTDLISILLQEHSQY